MNRTRYVLIALATAVLAVTTAATLEAQQGSIRGTVTDSANQGPIQGAQVSVVGTSSRTETNADGQYRIAGVSPGSVAVRVQLIGYAPAQTLVAVRPRRGSTWWTSRWRRAWPSSRRSCRSATAPRPAGSWLSAVSSVKAEELANQPIASVDAALQGKAAGVQVIQNAGNPGNAPSVRVRGSASVTASNDPLYVDRRDPDGVR